MDELQAIIDRLKEKQVAQKEASMAETGKCPFNMCDGSGRIIVERDGNYCLQVCKCIEYKNRQNKAALLFDNAHIPPRYKDKTFETFNKEEYPVAYETARRYVEKFESIRTADKNGLCFVGSTGTGKNHLAYSILHELLKKQVEAISVVIPDLLDALRPGENNQVSAARIRSLKAAEIVLYDDLGVEKSSDWVTERLYILINTRYNNKLPTLFTTNIHPQELERNLQWQRISSRIHEMCHIIVMDGEDYRKR